MERNAKVNLKPYEARVEFLALKEEIDRRSKIGHSIKSIYNSLKNEGELTMCYGSFCKYRKLSSSYELFKQKGGENAA